MLAVELDATLGRSAADALLRWGDRILLVGADTALLQQLERLLREAGLGPLTMSSDAPATLARFRELRPDAVVLEPVGAGREAEHLIRQLAARVPDTEFLPIAVVVDGATAEERQALLGLGVCDIIERNAGLADLPLRLQNALRIRGLAAATEQRVASRTEMLREIELELASRLAAVAELCDYGNAAHVQRVGRTAALIARQLGLRTDEVQTIRHAAPLHDIGKIAIPEAILLKSEPLTLEEWDVLKTHTVIGGRLLSGSSSPLLQVAEQIALYHHEHWNGTGYSGMSGEEIPLVGRIVTVADVFDALTHDRPYKSAWTAADSIEWIQSMRGQRFDPRVVDALVQTVRITDLTDLPPDAAAQVARIDPADVEGWEDVVKYARARGAPSPRDMK